MNPRPGKAWFVYVLQCSNGRLYTGITTDLAERFRKHAAGKGAMFTRLNKVSHMIAAKRCKDRSSASKLEWKIKQLRPDEKRRTVACWPKILALPGA